MRAIRTLRRARLTFLDERQMTQPWGLYGGRAAAPNDCYIHRTSGEYEQMPSKFDAVVMNPGDLWVMRTGGGGGWGNPFERDPERVVRDVAVGLITAEQARSWYGTIVKGNPPILDDEETAALRSDSDVSAEWIDRGEPQPAPGPGETWSSDTAPHPWLRADRGSVS